MSNCPLNLCIYTLWLRPLSLLMKEPSLSGGWQWIQRLPACQRYRVSTCRVLSHKWDTNITSPTSSSQGTSQKEMEREDWKSWERLRETIFWIWQKQCTPDLMSDVVAYIRSAQDEAIRHFSVDWGRGFILSRRANDSWWLLGWGSVSPPPPPYGACHIDHAPADGLITMYRWASLIGPNELL